MSAGDALTVLLRDADWLAVEKPSGVPTTAPPGAGVVSLSDMVRAGPGAGAMHAHPLSRLDVEVTGVVLFALTDRAIAMATRARERGNYRRRYVALVAGAVQPPRGTWEWTVGIDPRDAKKRVAGGGRDAQEARTRYLTLGTAPGNSAAWIALDLDTGRTHQIRVHASKAGHAILGDRAYNGLRHVTMESGEVVAARRVMLHALRVAVPGARRSVVAPVPADFNEVWRALGGGETLAG